jgi:hypothetical protein
MTYLREPASYFPDAQATTGLTTVNADDFDIVGL